MNAARQVPRFSVPYALGFAVLLTLVAWTLFPTLASAHHSPRKDEGYYLLFATLVQQHGVRIFPELFEAWNTNTLVGEFPLHGPSWWHPPPYRLGYILACAGWGKLFGGGLAGMSWLSAVSHLVCTTINWSFARRHLGDPFGLALAALCGFSPLLLGVGRLALMDSFTVVWVTLAVWLFLEMIEEPLAWAWQIAFALACTMAILTKELSVFIVPPLAAVALLERFARKRPLPLWRFAAVIALPGLIAGPLFILAAGGLERLLVTTKLVLSAPANIPYALLSCSGPWYRYLIDYLCLSAFPTVLGLLSVGALLQRIFEGEWSTPEVLFALLGAGLLAEQAPFIKNARYLLLFELPLRLLTLSLLFRLTRRVLPWRGMLLVGGAVAWMCFLDWQSFRHVFVDANGYDPVSVELLEAREIIPRP